ncbi:hypothetical protein ACTFIY_000263 [Dictyostelium cf. discoideum]
MRSNFIVFLESNKDVNSPINLIESIEKLSKNLDNFKQEIKNEISNKFNELKNQIIDSNTELLAKNVNGGVKYKIYDHQQPLKINENQIDDIIEPIEKPTTTKSPSKKQSKNKNKNKNNNNNINKIF